ncbi:MAG: hypothetical protein IPL61_35425 [Myxococcales bacterium]|nr:hypothetical protein [Myxococcales bacterium]
MIPRPTARRSRLAERALRGVVVAAALAGCGLGVHVKVGPSLTAGHPGATATVEGSGYIGDRRRSAALRMQVGAGYHVGMAPTLMLGVSTGPTWSDGRWAAGAGTAGYVGSDGSGIALVGAVDVAVAARARGGPGGCGWVSANSYAGYAVTVREVRVGAVAGALPGASFAWLPVSLGLVRWSLTCPPAEPPGPLGP